MSYTYQYPRPAVTVDAVVYALENEKLYLLLIRRKQDPFSDHWALPGGFMDMDEPPEIAVKRELKEETGIESDRFVQTGAFGAVDRDPRHRTISIAYFSLLKGMLPKVKGSDDAAEAKWFPVAELPKLLAFDHDHIISRSGEELILQLQRAEAGSAGSFGLSESEISTVLGQLLEK